MSGSAATGTHAGSPHAGMWIIRRGWRVAEVISSVRRPPCKVWPDEALFEVPEAFEGCVGDDVRWFEDSGARKPLSKLVAEGLVEVPAGYHLSGEALVPDEVPPVKRGWAMGFLRRVRWLILGRV